ncbi:MAG: hypothetical protein ABIH23_05005, partial [bacterium]
MRAQAEGHGEDVAKAIAEGKPVPPEVLAEFDFPKPVQSAPAFVASKEGLSEAEQFAMNEREYWQDSLARHKKAFEDYKKQGKPRKMKEEQDHIRKLQKLLAIPFENRIKYSEEWTESSDKYNADVQAKEAIKTQYSGLPLPHYSRDLQNAATIKELLRIAQRHGGKIRGLDLLKQGSEAEVARGGMVSSHAFGLMLSHLRPYLERDVLPTRKEELRERKPKGGFSAGIESYGSWKISPEGYRLLDQYKESLSHATPPPPEPDRTFVASPAAINLETAQRAHMGTSFVPEQRGEQEQRYFAQEVQGVYDSLLKYAKTDAQKALLADEVREFQANYAKKYTDVLHAKSRIMSTMITGGSKFPVRRMEKLNDAERKKSKDVMEWKGRAINAIKRRLEEKHTEEVGGPAAEMRIKLQKAEEMQEIMKKANAVVRKNISDDEKVRELLATGIFKSETTARKLLEPDYAGRKGFPTYELTNNLANIKRMRDRVAVLEGKEKTVERVEAGEIEGKTKYPFASGKVVDNIEADRYQIIYPGKPDAATIGNLKRRGFHWSPREGAWQRQRSTPARYAVKDITGVDIPTSNPGRSTKGGIHKEAVKGIAWEDLQYYGHRQLPKGGVVLKVMRAGSDIGDPRRGGTWYEVALRGEESKSSYGGVPGETGTFTARPPGVGGREVGR